MRFALLFAAFLFFSGQPLLAKDDKKVETAPVPGVDPLPFQEAVLNPDQLETFFEHQKKGTPIQLTLDKGKVVKGLFSSYDDYYQTVWVVPRGERGVFTEKGYKLTGIKNVVLWDRKAMPSSEPVAIEETGTEDYYLLKKEGVK